MQKQRFGNDTMLNARIPGGQVDKWCQLDASALAAMREVATRVSRMTTRGHDTLLKVARTVADLNNSRYIYKKHIAEAAKLCGYYDEVVGGILSGQSCENCNAELRSSDKFCSKCGHPAVQPSTA
jgi:hypothetical protein